MKIAILPVAQKFTPEKRIRTYPAHAKDYGVEQDFLIWLKKHPEHLTENFSEADWHYLPIFWTRWYVNHNYGKEGAEEIQSEYNRVVKDDRKTFTICQYAGGVKQDVGDMLQFQSSPLESTDFIIPLLCTHPNLPIIKPRKKFRASFVGRLRTHPIRSELRDSLSDKPDIFFYDGDDKSIKYYTRIMLKSYISLCPRGFGMGSFRLYESLFLGVPPLVIGDFDSRPFHKWIKWDHFSFYADNLETVINIIENTSTDELLKMGKNAKKVFLETLDFQNWCKYILMRLEEF